MAHRIGVCGSCKSRFQIPAAFAHKQAKCRSCGGVVQIGPLEGEPGPAPVPAPMRAAPPEPAPVPATAIAQGPRAVPAPPRSDTTALPRVPLPEPSRPSSGTSPSRSGSFQDRSEPPRRKRGALIGVLVVLGIAVLLALGLRSWLGS